MGAQAVGGRFEQSFVFHMIRDFFLLLLLVAAVELGIRYALLRLDFSRQEPARVAQAAQRLAEDVRSIMLNSGGPLAAQTVYPILDRNHEDLGLSIAVLPSPVTVESMQVSFKMDVRGLQPRWPEGIHREATAALKAEQFCLNCHVKARVGDVLGTVSVRSYLARKEAVWWQEVRLTAGALSLKILVHTVLLFLLLKVRMEPLLALRSTVSGLARGVMDLSPRAAVKTADEFGELAQDLNHFLDRIGGVVQDLDRVLGEVVQVGARLGTLNRGLERQVETMREASLRLLGDGAQRSLQTQLVAAREGGAYAALDRTVAQTLAVLPGVAAAADGPGAGAQQAPALRLLHEQLSELRASFGAVSEALQALAPPVAVAEAQRADYQAFAQSLREMAVLEASMQKVAESGQQVLQRLSQGRAA
ncbi:HAMP domain-containing protein [Rubrivivax sp. RP6-9]|uniref:HAMP domain-containing protein n=1 Tax=Rubrivivax sp. RP6-9 TaxID=3415750 RepID=UPI003CC585C2